MKDKNGNPYYNVEVIQKMVELSNHFKESKVHPARVPRFIEILKELVDLAYQNGASDLQELGVNNE